MGTSLSMASSCSRALASASWSSVSSSLLSSRPPSAASGVFGLAVARALTEDRGALRVRGAPADFALQ